MNAEQCDRCEATVLNSPVRDRRWWTFYKEKENEIITQDMQLCSVCENELYEWAVDDVDRSDMVEPKSIDRLRENVNRHIDSLEGILNDLNDIPTDE